MAALVEKGEPARDTMFRKWNHQSQWAVRKGEWKLLVNPLDPSNSYPLDPVENKVFLTNLKEDISKSRNLASLHPDKVRELVEAYREWEHATEVDLLEVEHRRPALSGNNSYIS